jgi:hypothetical protein
VSYKLWENLKQYINIVLCAYVNKMYVRSYAMVTWHFWISLVYDNEKCLLVFKSNARRGLLALGSKMKTILGSTEEEIWTGLSYNKLLIDYMSSFFSLIVTLETISCGIYVYMDWHDRSVYWFADRTDNSSAQRPLLSLYDTCPHFPSGGTCELTVWIMH